MHKSIAVVLVIAILTLLGYVFSASTERVEAVHRLHGPSSEAASGETKLAPLDSGKRRLDALGERGEDPAPALPKPEMYLFALAVQLQDSNGLPYSGVEVQIAPPDHPFVTFATTNSDGFAAVEFGALGKRLFIDLAFVDADFDLSGFHRLQLLSDKVRTVRVSVPRQSKTRRSIKTKIKLARARALEMVEDRLAMRGIERRTGILRRGVPFRPDRYTASVMSGLDIFGVATSKRDIEFGSNTYQIQLNTLKEEIENERTVLKGLYKGEGVGTISGQVLDGAGDPVSIYPVWAEFSGPRDVEKHTVFTVQDGSFSINVLPGEVRCYVGQGNDILIKDFRISKGENLQWYPIVSLKSTVRLRLPNGLGDNYVKYEVQANVDDGQTLTITRRRFNARGLMLFPVHDSLPTSLHLMYINGRVTFPIHHIGFFSGGDSKDLDSGDCSPSFGTATVPSFKVPGTRPTFFPEALVLLSEEDWGYRAGLKSDGHELAEFLIPLGHWRVDMSFGAMGRKSLGPVSIEGTSSFALPSFVVPEPGVLKLDSAFHGTRFVTVTQLREDILTRAYESEHVFEAGQGLRMTVRPGEYRVEVAGEDGPQYSGVVTVLAGQTALLDV